MSQQRLDADVLIAPGLLLHPGDHDGQAGHGEGSGVQEEEAEARRHGHGLRGQRCSLRSIPKSRHHSQVMRRQPKK